MARTVLVMPKDTTKLISPPNNNAPNTEESTIEPDVASTLRIESVYLRAIATNMPPAACSTPTAIATPDQCLHGSYGPSCVIVSCQRTTNRKRREKKREKKRKRKRKRKKIVAKMILV